MKCAMALSAVVLVSLTACDTMNQPITGSGDFDPLRPPGGNTNYNLANPVVFTAGQFVRASMNNTAFFKNRPNGDSDADKLLTRGTSMKVIAPSGSFLKVELDTGEVGFVPSVMVEDPKANPGGPATNPGEYQVYPPSGNYGAPLPSVNPSEQPPGGSIPTVIDPEAPASTVPVPPASSLKVNPPAPAEPKTGPAPLPPNEEDLKAGRKTPEPTPRIEQ